MPQTVPVRMVPRGPARPRWGRVAWLLGLALSLGCVSRSQAATTWMVCASGCDYTRIKAAIAAPTALDGDTLAIAAGTYTEAGISVNKSLTLQGEAAATTIVQGAASQGTAPDRVFTIASGVTATLQDLTIRYGRTTGSGGGLANFGTLTLTHSTIRLNTSPDGGGLYNRGTLTLTNSTVSGNTAAFAGGLYNSYGILILTHSTVSGNTVTENGSGFWNGGTLTLTSSIVANNPAGGDCRTVSGSITSDGYNLDSDGSCSLTAATDLPGTDPRLGPLQDNGGPTFTHALLPGSAAIDVIPWSINGCGTTHIGDQRWQARPQPAGGACDIGAYEVEVVGQPLEGWVTGLTPRPWSAKTSPPGTR
jgi:hypothetical protein